MAKMGRFSVSGMKELQNQLNKIQKEKKAFISACAKDLASRLLEFVIKRTPVGDYSGDPYSCDGGQSHKGSMVSGKVGGTLRRGWTAKTHEEAASSNGKDANIEKYINSIEIKHVGNIFVVEVVNPVEYASYVEHGHRTANHKGWVLGHFMLTISEQELEDIAPKVLEQKIERYLWKCMK